MPHQPREDVERASNQYPFGQLDPYPQLIVEYVGLMYETVRRRTDANGNDPYCPLERDRARPA